MCHCWELRQTTAHLLDSAELLIYISMTGQKSYHTHPWWMATTHPKATTSQHSQCLKLRTERDVIYHRQLSRGIRFTTVTDYSWQTIKAIQTHRSVFFNTHFTSKQLMVQKNPQTHTKNPIKLQLIWNTNTLLYNQDQIRKQQELKKSEVAHHVIKRW